MIGEKWEGFAARFHWEKNGIQEQKSWSAEINQFKLVTRHLTIAPHLQTHLLFKRPASVLQKDLN